MFKGSIVALVTPFHDGKIDENGLREFIEFQIAAGTHALVAAGTTGESGTLSHQEKLQVIKIVIDQTKERIPVIAGTAMNATRDCIELTREAMTLGAHAALIMTPAYIKPTQEGLYQHFSQIAAEVPIPIIMYNIPGRTACDMLPETVARLAKVSNIVGIKEATAQMTRLQQILKLCDTSLDVFSGDDFTAAHWMLAGAKGVISAAANVVPRQMAKLCDAALDGDSALCLRLNEQLMPLFQQLYVETNPIAVKWALAKMKLMSDELRLPLTSLDQSYHHDLEQALLSLQLI